MKARRMREGLADLSLSFERVQLATASFRSRHCAAAEAIDMAALLLL